MISAKGANRLLAFFFFFKTYGGSWFSLEKPQVFVIKWIAL